MATDKNTKMHTEAEIQAMLGKANARGKKSQDETALVHGYCTGVLLGSRP